jgi:hypothetical protein
MQAQKKGKIGDQIRKIADQLKLEADVQIKATSRILSSAAQISENHDRLINEVVDMVVEDHDSSSSKYHEEVYTVDFLKLQFKTLTAAKKHFGLKASSWKTLTHKLNNQSFKFSISNEHSDNEFGKRLDKIEKEISFMNEKLSQILFLIEKHIQGKE